MLRDMAAIAAECIRRPNRRAVWCPQLGRYVSPDVEDVPAASLDPKSHTRPPINSQFKLVFLTAAGGTLLFVSLCVALMLATGREPNLMTEIIRGLFSLAQIGFGAVVGLLGGKRLQGDDGQ